MRNNFCLGAYVSMVDCQPREKLGNAGGRRFKSGRPHPLIVIHPLLFREKFVQLYHNRRQVSVPTESEGIFLLHLL